MKYGLIEEPTGGGGGTYSGHGMAVRIYIAGHFVLTELDAYHVVDTKLCQPLISTTFVEGTYAYICTIDIL